MERKVGLYRCSAAGEYLYSVGFHLGSSKSKKNLLSLPALLYF